MIDCNGGVTVSLESVEVSEQTGLFSGTKLPVRRDSSPLYLMRYFFMGFIPSVLFTPFSGFISLLFLEPSRPFHVALGGISAGWMLWGAAMGVVGLLGTIRCNVLDYSNVCTQVCTKSLDGAGTCLEKALECKHLVSEDMDVFALQRDMAECPFLQATGILGLVCFSFGVTLTLWSLYRLSSRSSPT
jgi:hypothetical protein